jgi:hypothetical protein
MSVGSPRSKFSGAMRSVTKVCDQGLRKMSQPQLRGPRDVQAMVTTLSCSTDMGHGLSSVNAKGGIGTNSTVLTQRL